MAPVASKFLNFHRYKKTDGCILSWNCRGISNKKSELIELINANNPACICIQETKLRENHNFNFQNYVFEHKSQIIGENEWAKGGVGVLIKPGINYTPINLNTNFQAIAVQLNLHRKITICSIYIPPVPTFNFTEHDLQELIKQLPSPFILTGDFNSHSTLWHDKNTDQRGKIIENILIKNNINLLDERGQTFRRGTLESHPDLTLVSPELCTEFSWDMYEDLCSSDHVPIIINPKEKCESYSTPRFNFNKANWSRFSSLANFEKPISSFNSIDDLNTYITSTILDAAHKTIPVTKPIEGKIPVPWWNECLSNSKKQKNIAYKKYNKRPSSQNSLFYRKKNAEHKRLLEISKKKYYFDFLSGINSQSSLSDVWKKIGVVKKKSKPTNITSLKIENQVVLDKKEIVNGLAKNMAHISSFNGRNKDFLDFKHSHTEEISFSCNDKNDYNTPITKRELNASIQQCNMSAVGEDNIHYLMLKNLSSKGIKYIRDFFNLIYLKGFFPKSWRDAVIIPILKGDSDPSDPSSYRPISLISCLSRLLEKIINKRLIWYLEKMKLLDINQLGFRIGKSTLDSITALVSEIQRAFENNKYHITIFLDLEKAFDSCWKQHVLKQIKNFNICGCLPVYIKNFLYNRTIKVRTNKTLSDPYNLQMGIPQGSALSATLFLIAVNSIVNNIKNYMCKSVFVDDARISYTTNDLKQGEEKMQGVINDLVSWGDKTGFNFSGKKSVVMIFTKKPGNEPKVQIKLRNQILKVVTEKKFLGMIFDSKLNWKAHIAKIKNKSTSGLNLLKTLASSKHKTNSNLLLNVYMSMLLSRIEYGCQAYSSASNEALQVLDVIHNNALRICLGAFRTTPLNSLYVEANINSLENRRQFLNMEYYFRVLQIERESRHSNNIVDIKITPNLNRNCLGFKLREILNNYQTGTINILNIKPLPTPPWLIPTIDVCFELCKKSKHNFTHEELRVSFYEHKHESRITIYTDGSKSEKGTGAGIVVERKCDDCLVYDNYKIKLNALASIFSAELVAIESAVNSVKLTKNTSITIYSDSKSALQAIVKYDSKNPIVQNIHILLLILYNNNNKIKFCWIPAHCDIKGNELADKAAKNATKFSKKCNNPILFSDVKAFLREKCRQKWQLDWNSKVNNKLFKVDSSVGKRDFSGFQNRISEIKFTRLRLGHTKLTHKHLLLNEQQPVCEVCNCIISIEHIITKCPKYETKRIRFLGSREIKMSDALKRVNSQKNNILRFLQNTRLFHEI